MPKRKQISGITLQLNDKQRMALQSDNATPKGLGINQATYNKWFQDPYFRALWYAIEDYEVEHDEINKYEVEFKAAALVYYGFTYEAIENHLSLKSGTIVEWTDSENEDGEVFRSALKHAEEHDPKRKQKEEAAHSDLANKQSLALPLILTGKSDQQVADEIGVSRHTILNWRNRDKHFMKELKEAKESLRQTQLATLSRIVDKAFKTVEELLDSQDPKVRMRTALNVLNGTYWKPPKWKRRQPQGIPIIVNSKNK